MHGNAPFLIVITDRQAAASPGAANGRLIVLEHWRHITRISPARAKARSQGLETARLKPRPDTNLLNTNHLPTEPALFKHYSQAGRAKLLQRFGFRLVLRRF